MAPDQVVCPYCKGEVTAVDAGDMGGLPGYSATQLGEAIRYLIVGERAFLHHGCGDSNLRWLVPDPDENWFACWYRDRAINSDALFDKFCERCEQRWGDEGFAFWHPQDLSDSEIRALQKVLEYHDFKKPSFAYNALFRTPHVEIARSHLKEGSARLRRWEVDRARPALEIAAELGDEDVTHQASALLQEMDEGASG